MIYMCCHVELYYYPPPKIPPVLAPPPNIDELFVDGAEVDVEEGVGLLVAAGLLNLPE